ncbi:TPA: nucleotide exchange factor GrpE [Candidatus Woesearchaeota archaeon]|nr:nucleotide exchange factor GrpE [Candidatus Woesearchaeota archaeon]HIH32216.1 nucleotide exchange factor GrpE [Candidatus Woesearchaeota archaeon]HIH54716.1 nucleotide exchange factor GrpE [Candidatus Woesearchaeota archaeon]HIJ01463.1 nucleotide exchange factor GrpE [Candidatus Woesearchaeota archaeon]HIJ14671.1 nucleotide exchange factor GrpE [Candidatus Woesearchaeota archaeon]
MKKKQESTENNKIEEQKDRNPEITQEQFDDLTTTLQRIQAEFENYKKRIEKENQSLIKNANADLIKQLLPVLDSFELAIKNSNGNQEIDKFKKGLELIYAQLFNIMEDQGLRIIDTKNQKFDPYKHEVLLVKESGKEEDFILEEFQKGYMLNSIVLRHSKVMIAKHKDDNQQTDTHEVK